MSHKFGVEPSKMRGDVLLKGKMIDRNWILKRKRKRVSSILDPNGKAGTSRPLNSPRSIPSVKPKKEDDISGSEVGQKIKGHDGYYYECVECDLGGDLLCCDSCPRTYHRECLSPPLKHNPPGKWQCPICQRKDFMETSTDSEEHLISVRSTSCSKKSKSVFKQSEHKASHSGRNSLQEKNILDNRGKTTFPSRSRNMEKNSDFTQVDTSDRTKSSSLPGGGSRNSLSTPADNNDKKPRSPCNETSSQKDVSFFVKSLSPGLGDNYHEEKSYLAKGQMECKKHINLLVRSTRKSKKKSRKARKKDKKRSKNENGQLAVNSLCSQISKEIPPIPEINGSLQKSNPVNKSSASVANVKSRIPECSPPELPEEYRKEAALKSQGLNKQVEVDDEINHDSSMDGVKQVDRILGCRERSFSALPCSSLNVTKNRKMLEDCNIDGELVRIMDSEGLLGVVGHDDTKCTAQVKDVKIHEDCSDKTGQTVVHLSKSEVKISVTKSSTDQYLTEENCALLQDPAVDLAGIGHIDLNEVTEDNANVKFISAVGEITKPSVESGDTSIAAIPTLQESKVENRIPQECEQELRTKRDTVMYEFLVKWAGTSNIHNSWVSESSLKILAKRKLENYKAKYGNEILNICKEQWSEPQRVIALRVSKESSKEALVKWCDLPYDECTWEKLDEPGTGKYATLVTEFIQFESETWDKDSRDDFAKSKGDYPEVKTLTEQPKELQGGSLFPHQLEALNWLRKCWQKSKNVILADEMGLGKTISACSFISSLYSEFKAKLPCLVLVPLSTMPNWLAEFALWAPHLNVLEYHGSAKARSIIRQYEWHAGHKDGHQKKSKTYRFNVLLTTYEMVLADSSHLRVIPWEVLVVDEGHRLKNSGSKLFGLLNTFKFQHRVLLTGTPLQNNFGEMYNLLNFLQPVSFPSLSSFEEKFNDLNTAEKVEELKKLVAPHMLRRLKRDAMQNIHPKSERTVPVELTSIQAEYYRAMLTKNYQLLRNTGKGGAMQSMLNIVMQLRKVCNHPYLIPGTEPESGSNEFLQEMRIKASAKLTLLHSMLKILHKNGHRVLIFSQMTKLLDILEDYMNIEFGPETFERVDGSLCVADRQAAIARFNQDKTRFVFLLSTRSCGLGINLATADTVIIYDSDFNPHADIQAMNRAHRIGQSKKLLVYRLVVRASVEERILQLAKKKLMLDQLFVNKSESQKEVQDILRWGTEELFNDCDVLSVKDLKETSNDKLDSVGDGEQKHRKRSGGLGDVYEDKCTDGSGKIIWDENAILKLLDRSNIQSSVSESTNGDLENDMLGPVKAVDWNEELNEESGGSELLPYLAGAECDEQPSEAKEEHTEIVAEENEWDRLLRVRWERNQLDEEASLGRGKRLRKAVSYKETFAPMPSNALSEPSGQEEEEPEPEYTPAGRDLKEKFAKLRARQKSRIAQRHITKAQSSEVPQFLEQSRILCVKAGETLYASKLVQDTEGQGSAINLEDTSIGVGRLANKRFQSTSSASSIPTSNLLPVLALYAPNANQGILKSRTPRSVSKQALPCHEQRTTSGIPVFPFLPTVTTGTPDDTSCKGKEATDTSLFPDTSGATEHSKSNNFITGSYIPFFPPVFMPSSQGPSYPLESSGASFSAFKEKLVLPDIAYEERPQPKFSFPSMNAVNSHIGDLLPSLTLGLQPENLTHLPSLPNFRQNPYENLKQKQPMAEPPPMLDLLKMQATHASLAENHKKVLDNIMMRTQYSTNKFMKKRLKANMWSEEELDTLWVGVRRHGRGSWDAMLRDSKLKFAKHRTSEDLSLRWAEEQKQILDGPAFASPVPSSATLFAMSDGMMTRALLGSKFSTLEPPNFPLVGTTDPYSAVNESPPLPVWNPGGLGPNQSGGISTEPYDMVDKGKIPLDQTLRSTSLLGTSYTSLNLNSSSSCTLQQNESGLYTNKKLHIPSIMDKTPRPLHFFDNTVHSVNPNLPMPPYFQKQQADGNKSKTSELPHWLRDAVSLPPSRVPKPELPPTALAIAHSVRLIYGEEKPTIPPFKIPGLPPCKPEDPRISLKKKRKLQRFRQTSTGMATPTESFDLDASSMAPPLVSGARMGPIPSFPSLNLNLLSSLDITHGKHPLLHGSGTSQAPIPLVFDLPSPSGQITGKQKTSRRLFLACQEATGDPADQIENGTSSNTLSDLGNEGISFERTGWNDAPSEHKT